MGALEISCLRLFYAATGARWRRRFWSGELSVETKSRVDIVVNGEPHGTSATTLAELVRERGLEEQRVATACNGDFVPERERAATELRPGDRIEILSPRHGG